MLRKTVKEYKRRVESWDIKYNDEHHFERILRETWSIFWIIPIYSRETILTTNIQTPTQSQPGALKRLKLNKLNTLKQYTSRCKSGRAPQIIRLAQRQSSAPTKQRSRFRNSYLIPNQCPRSPTWQRRWFQKPFSESSNLSEGTKINQCPTSPTRQRQWT